MPIAAAAKGTFRHRVAADAIFHLALPFFQFDIRRHSRHLGAHKSAMLSRIEILLVITPVVAACAGIVLCFCRQQRRFERTWAEAWNVVHDHTRQVAMCLEMNRPRLEWCEKRVDAVHNPLSAMGAYYLGASQRIIDTLNRRFEMLQHLTVERPADPAGVRDTVDTPVQVTIDNMNAVIGAPTIPTMTFDEATHFLQILLDRVEEEIQARPGAQRTSGSG